MGRIYQKHYVAIIIVFVPAFVLNVWLGYDRYMAQLRSASALGEQTAGYVAAAIGDGIASTDQNVRSMAWFLGTYCQSAQQIRGVLETMLSENAELAGLAWYSDNGNILFVQAQGGSATVFDDAYKRQYGIASNIEDGVPKVTPEGVVFRHRSTGVHSGMLLAEANTDQLLSNLIDRYAAGWHTRILDASGKPIWGDISKSCSAQGRSMALGASRVMTMDVEKCVSVKAMVADLGWTVELSQKTHPFLSLAASRGNTALFLIAMVSLFWVCLVVSDVLGRVQALRDAAGKIAAGDLSARVEVSGSDDITDAAISFNRMASRIQELETTRDLFLQTAAHELRNPMAGVKGILSLVRRRVDMQRPIGELTHMLEMAEHEADRTSTLLNDILDAFRSQRGQLNLRRERVSLAEVVSSAVAPYAAMNEHRLVVKGLTNHVITYGDGTRLGEVVRNLVSNALKYSPPDSIVRISLGTEGTQAIITVADNGYGIPAAEQPRLFEEFFRGSNSRGCDPGGLGLGLYITKQIVERHEGSINVESEVGRGTTFTIKLPLVAIGESAGTPTIEGETAGA